LDRNKQKLLLKLYRSMGSPYEEEYAKARKELLKILESEKLTWNDLSRLVAEAEAASARDVGNSEPPMSEPPPGISVLDLIHHVMQDYLDLRPEERIAISLWILHAHTFESFKHSPRLIITSPVHGCGKTSALEYIGNLVNAHRTNNATAATVFRRLDYRQPLLLDEGDNLGIVFDRVLRSVLNGFQRGDIVDRYIKGELKSYSTFAPIAVAVIGALPRPLTSRSVVIPMRKSDGKRELKRFDESTDTREFPLMYGYILNWRDAHKDKLRLADPKMPTELRDRARDVWRPLIAIADTFGLEWGKKARDAAVVLSRGRHDEDIKVTLLRDTRDIFDTLGVDRILSDELVAKLNDLEDGAWSEWRGVRDDQPPHKLTRAEMQHMLRIFGIRPRSVWPIPRRPTSKSRKGYYREDLGLAWAAYCPETGTPAQASNVRHLRRHGSGTA
jgi:Protein of unknown function (DUF3631)